MADASKKETSSLNRSSQIIVLSFLLLAFILLYSTNQIEETSPLVWKSNVLYDNLFYRDEVPGEYREYIQFSARVINRTFPYIKQWIDEGTSWVDWGLKDVLALERLEPSDDNVSRYYIYSEDFGLYDIPGKLNESINGITMSDLLLADYVEVSGYSFLVSSGPTTLHRIFCILDLEAVFPIETTVNDVKVIIEEADYNVSGREAVDKVLNMSGYDYGYRIWAVTSSSGKLENGTVINEMVWLVDIYVTPANRMGGTIVHGIVDVHTGKVYDMYLIGWISSGTPAG